MGGEEGKGRKKVPNLIPGGKGKRKLPPHEVGASRGKKKKRKEGTSLYGGEEKQTSTASIGVSWKRGWLCKLPLCERKES